jgi:hypothetical protein
MLYVAIALGVVNVLAIVVIARLGRRLPGTGARPVLVVRRAQPAPERSVSNRTDLA